MVKLLWSVLASLNQKLDRRLVSTFLGLVMAIIMHWHRNNGLLLSELGGYLLGAEQCRAGTKRISNLIHTEKWNAGVIEDFLWKHGTERVEELWEQAERPLVIWDESVLEKPESLQAEGLCAAQAHQAWFFQSTGGTTRLCARLSLAEDSGGWTPGNSYIGSYGLVDHRWRAVKPETDRGKHCFGSHSPIMGQASVAYLGSWLCWQPLADPSLPARRSFCIALAEELPIVG